MSKDIIILSSYSELNEYLNQLSDSTSLTFITDLILESELETGFDAINLLRKKQGKQLKKVYICTSLASNEQIKQIAQDLEATVLEKQFIENFKIISQSEI